MLSGRNRLFLLSISRCHRCAVVVDTAKLRLKFVALLPMTEERLLAAASQRHHHHRLPLVLLARLHKSTVTHQKTTRGVASGWIWLKLAHKSGEAQQSEKKSNCQNLQAVF